MVKIKKIYLEGFKSFAKPTEVLFDKGINVIVGPNGSGKSNIVDAICFAFGSLGIKSMRADKASSLIFKGKNLEKDKAIVKVFLENPGVFSIENEKPPEIVIERITNKNGTSVYKINGKTKTRNEVLELLSMANLNPYGFNIIRQQEIFKFVEMKPEERRKLIEDLAGISIYETRKEKAMRELERTEEKLKEIKTILNEKQNFLSNLEKEKKQAELYNKLKNLIEILRYSIIWKRKNDKLQEKEKAIQKYEEYEKERKRKEEKINNLSQKLDGMKREIDEIDRFIEEITGIKQISLQNEITELKTQIARLEVRKNSFENSLNSLTEKIKSLKTEEISLEKELERLKEEQQKNLGESQKDKLKKVEEKIKENQDKLRKFEKRKEELEALEKNNALLKEKLALINKEYLAIREKIDNLRSFILEMSARISKIDDHIEEKIKKVLEENEKYKSMINEKIKIINKNEREIEIINKEIDDINKLEICPKCKRKIDEEFKKNLLAELREKIKGLENEIKKASKDIEIAERKKESLEKNLEKLREEEKKLLENKFLEERIKETKAELNSLLSRKKELENLQVSITNEITKHENIEISIASIDEEIVKIKEVINNLIIQKEKVKREIDINVSLDFEISVKERELSNIRSVLLKSEREKEKIIAELKNLNDELFELNKLLGQKQEKMQEIQKRFSDLINKKNNLHNRITDVETEIAKLRSEILLLNEKTNEININIAKIDAEIAMLDEEEKEISEGVRKEDRIIKDSLQKLEERLSKAKAKLEELGNINLLAIETYDHIKQEIMHIEEKFKRIDEERQEILKQIEKIDREKKKIFMDTFNKINKNFSDNFARLSSKGITKLVLENPKHPFEGGVDIVLKLGKGKYFDSFSLSGGEKVLVALAFIFAIQNISPYYFYIFDEIDAALDKRNSERFADLLKRHIGNSQCIIITHNDSTIRKADLIYGISMQDGISKVLSLKL